ncbi:MAG: GGDEF domain-containing protein [Clostridia bacterium]|nr:GGDEF domain-containing protein [Clostridia bacterium]MCI2000811.1 GGDEF domain-containing protein [Clostridia bacterium]MCI2015397.1 GGDEF domain-containing protein [Clostridia bacterium]
MKFQYTFAEMKKQIICSSENFDVVRIVNPKTGREYSIEVKNGKYFIKKKQDCICLSNKLNSKCGKRFSQKVYFSEFDNNDGRKLKIVSKHVNLEGKHFILEMISETHDNVDELKSRLNKYADIMKMQKKALITDSLTTVYNRRYIDNIFSHDCKNINGFCLAVMDIDKFKHINDMYGHTLGDAVLGSTAKYWKKYFGCDRQKFIARFGGDEFILVSKDSNLIKFKNNIESLYISFRKTEIFSRNKNIDFTLSIGCASADESENKNFNDIFDIADKRLYLVKNNGGNNIL